MRFGIFGWGVVAPKSPDVEAFAKNLESSETWLAPFNGFGPDNFLVGTPQFQFEHYKPWIDQRFTPRQYQTLKEKMDLPTLYAIGAFIQSLRQNPEIETALRELEGQAHVYLGTGLGSLATIHDESIKLYKAQRCWDAFWSDPEYNSALREYQSNRDAYADAPPKPETISPANRDEAEQTWRRYWMERSPELARYLSELAAIDGLNIEGEIGAGKLNVIREKEKRRTKLQEEWNAPEPPWKVSANLIWNIHNTPSAQISILGKIKGLAFAPVAACSTFGVALRLAMRAIEQGDAKLVVVGATDPPPHPLTVGSFYSARVLSADRTVSVPLTRLQGTHVAGGAVVWILGDLDYCRSRGFRPLGMEPISVGVSSDAHHIITPSSEGPQTAMQQALSAAGATPDQIGTWDLHATATPGDYSEVASFRSIFPDSVYVTARKGTFGHGMSAGGGWELTAQYLGYQLGRLFPTPLTPDSLNSAIRQIHGNVVYDTACEFPQQLGGKLSMGIGGINACVISRPWD